jgi:hypothetical protein
MDVFMYIKRFRNDIKPTPQMSRNFITISKGERREFVLDVAICLLMVLNKEFRTKLFERLPKGPKRRIA